MAWNDSSRSGCSGVRAVARARASGIGGRRLAGFAVLALVAVGGLVLWFLFLADSGGGAVDRIEPPAKQPGRTAATSPAAVVPQPGPRAASEAVDPNARPTKVGEVVNGYVMLPSGRIHRPTGVVTNRMADHAKSRYSIFERRSDNEIAAILMMRPGGAVVGAKRYDGWFTRQFLESLETPIVPDADDEPWKADLKRAVAQARLDLKAAHDRGEDVAEIMAESRRQLRELAGYRQNAKRLYAENRRLCETAEQVASLQEAVNRMLEERGCAPINFTPLAKQSLLKDKSHE